MIELARELGLALANSCEFTQMKQAQSDFEQNEAISLLMQELNEKRDRLIAILSDGFADKRYRSSRSAAQRKPAL